ncbi:MAG: hypothetical protein SGI91_08130 [Alphaproteobacteria bacterium]|mgnify:CR=1 FL=1|nr:hypothetical protein [Alphaproteobacteria bacterium]
MRIRHALFLLALVVAAPAHASDRLEGWGSYKFGMTMKEVLVLRGIKWTKREGLLETTTPISIGGLSYTGSMKFSEEKGRLTTVELRSVLQRSSFADCTRNFESALIELERRYGGFVPLLLREASVKWKAIGDISYSETASERSYRGEGVSPIQQYAIRYHSLGAWRWFGESVVEVQAFHEQPSRFVHNQQPVPQEQVGRQQACKIHITYAGRHSLSLYNIPLGERSSHSSNVGAQ